MLSNENIKLLETGGYEYILGARIKACKRKLKEKILQLQLKNGESKSIKIDTQSRIIVSHSESRAKKDIHNRERGLKKIEKQIKSGKLTKANINNRGYNKFLELKGEVIVEINPQKIIEDQNWDGLKGYITNSKLNDDEILENYKELWHIEKAIRIAKTDLEIRPIYHRKRIRIEAHICIAFVAYKVYKELERQLKQKESTLSAEKAIEIAKTIYAIKIVHPFTKNITYSKIIKTEEQSELAKMFEF